MNTRVIGAIFGSVAILGAATVVGLHAGDFTEQSCQKFTQAVMLHDTAALSHATSLLKPFVARGADPIYLSTYVFMQCDMMPDATVDAIVASIRRNESLACPMQTVNGVPEVGRPLPCRGSL